jgi:hypothetical protein
MSGTFPTTGFTAMELKSNNRVRLTESVSGKTQRIQSGGQFWSFKLKSPPLERSEFNAIYSFVVQQNGQAEAFTVVPPVISNTTGTMAGTMTVSSVSSADPLMNVSAGSNAVGVVEDSTAEGTLKKGDLIKFSNHDKVYMVTEDFTLSNDSSVQPLKFYPPLTTSVVGGTTTITYNSVPFRVFFNTDEVSYELLNDGYYRYEIDVREEI